MKNRVCKAVLFFLLPMGMFLSGCEVENKPAALIEPDYFDLETLLQKNIALLNQMNAGVTKAARNASGYKEVEELEKLNWARELDVFSQAAINRPAWRDAFTAETIVKPDGTKLVRYIRKPGYDAPVEFMQVLFTPANQPGNIQASVSSDNMLFYTSKHLELELNPDQVLKQYSVRGVQKLLFSDTMRYELQGVVLSASE